MRYLRRDKSESHENQRTEFRERVMFYELPLRKREFTEQIPKALERFLLKHLVSLENTH